MESTQVNTEKITDKTSSRSFMISLATKLNKKPEDVEKFIVIFESNWIEDVASIKKVDDAQWQTLGIPAGVVNHIKGHLISSFLSEEQKKQLNGIVPGDVNFDAPLYKMSKDGDLGAFYDIGNGQGPLLFAFLSDEGKILGAYTNIKVQKPPEKCQDNQKGNGNSFIFTFKDNQLHKIDYRQNLPSEVAFWHYPGIGYGLNFLHASICIADKDIKEGTCSSIMSAGGDTLPSYIKEVCKGFDSDGEEYYDGDELNYWLIGKKQFGITDIEVFKCTGTVIKGDSKKE